MRDLTTLTLQELLDLESVLEDELKRIRKRIREVSA